MKQSGEVNSRRASALERLLSFVFATAWSAYLYVFSEWLFFVTKPSFFDVMNWGEKLSVLVKTSLLLTILGCLFLFTIMILSWFLSQLGFTKGVQYLPVVVPAGIVTALVLLIVDNFTYTVFRFGVVTTSGIWRGVYAVVFILLYLLVFRWFLDNTSIGVKAERELQAVTNSSGRFLVLLLVFSVAVFFLDSSTIGSVDTDLQAPQIENRPNILLLGSDGINAVNMSVYGYDRKTTPNISALAEKSLLMENAFPNAGNSAGSVVTILTGKNATETRVLYPPDILTGVDSYQHLPGILHRQGYYTVELGVDHYVDAYDINIINGFDEVNGKLIQQTIVMRVLEPLGYDVAYYSSKVVERIKDRLFHIFYIKKMENVFNAVVDPSISVDSDKKKIKHLLRLFSESEQPLFVHLHLMGTHGSIFFPHNRVFSNGKEQNDFWMTDFYDDSILDYDNYVGDVLGQLEKSGALDNTIIVIYTDHNMKFSTNQRIPLIIYFPDGKFAGRVSENSQNLDIAPTILQYLGLSIPEWMEGASLLSKEFGNDRLIFSAGAAHVKESNGVLILDAEQLKPPFYQFGYIGIINCQHWYRYDLIKNDWEFGFVAGHTPNCDDNELLAPEQIKNALLTHLKDKGFNISSLMSDISIPPPIITP